MAMGNKGSTSSGSNWTGGPARTQDKRGDSKKILKVIYWIAVLVALCCAYANIRPYQIAVGHFFGGALSKALVKVLANMPIINGIALIFGKSITWLVGALVWLLLQSVETFPIILQRDRAFMRTLINASEAHQKFEVKENDDPTLSALKRWYNIFPTVTLARARNAALFCYVIDFLVVSSVYPPAKNFGTAVFYIMSGQFSRLNWTNIFYLLITLFAVELLIRFLFWLGEIAYFMKNAHKTN